MKTLVFGCVIALVASGASAQMLADFEGGANPFGVGSIVADPDDPANNVLYLTQGELGILPITLAIGEQVTMKVYDQGLSAMDDLTDPANPVPAADSRPACCDPSQKWYGWNIGVSGTWNWGFTCSNYCYSGCNSGYQYTGYQYVPYPTNGSIHSIDWFGGPRQVDALSIIGAGSVENPDIPGDGAWSTFIWQPVAGGGMYMANDRAATGSGLLEKYVVEDLSDPLNPKPSPGEMGITSIFVNGGTRTGYPLGCLADVWIDDVQIVAGGGPNCDQPGDADEDGDVDLDDFVILKNNWGGPGGDCTTGDFDASNSVDLDDFVILKNNWGAQAVPEPASMCLLALGGLALVRRRSR